MCSETLGGNLLLKTLDLSSKFSYRLACIEDRLKTSVCFVVCFWQYSYYTNWRLKDDRMLRDCAITYMPTSVPSDVDISFSPKHATSSLKINATTVTPDSEVDAELIEELQKIALLRKQARLEFSVKMFLVQAAFHAKQETLREKACKYPAFYFVFFFNDVKTCWPHSIGLLIVEVKKFSHNWSARSSKEIP